MRLVILAVLLVLMLGCAQQNPAVINQTVQPPANISNTTPPSNNTVPPANTSVPNISISNTTSNITAPPNQTIAVPNQTMNMTANSTRQGLVFDDGKYSLVLDDVSLMQAKPCGIFSIRNMNGSIMDGMVICPTQSQTWIAPDGHEFRIRADDVAAGYSKQAMWANVEIFG